MFLYFQGRVLQKKTGRGKEENGLKDSFASQSKPSPNGNDAGNGREENKMTLIIVTQLPGSLQITFPRFLCTC